MTTKKAEKQAPRPPTGASKQLQQQGGRMDGYLDQLQQQGGRMDSYLDQLQQQGGRMDSYLDQLHFKAKDIPQTPAIKRFKVSCIQLKLLWHN